jgi:hypothetical protein
VAKTSLAHRVAERLGVTHESLRALMWRNNPELRPARAETAPARPMPALIR